MNIKDAMYKRHMVRRYTDKPIPTELIQQLNGRTKINNQKYGLKIKLVINNTDAFTAPLKLFLAKNVKNFFIMAGDEAPDIAERLGYSGADLMLYAQTLGLNTWWVGGTFNHRVTKKLAGAKVVIGIIAVGFGADDGIPHRRKSFADVSEYEGTIIPEWFKDGVEAALLAPTAMNSQNFYIKGKGDEVHLSVKESHFIGEERGLIKYHFELGAGKENFRWTDRKI